VIPIRLLLCSALLLAGCGDGLVTESGRPSRTLVVKAGQELHLTLQTLGPGAYASPPSISSPAVRFLDESQVIPVVPAGSTQRFRFLAVLRGEAVVIFTHTGQNPVIHDTIIVR
jgi:hypothetical protein